MQPLVRISLLLELPLVLIFIDIFSRLIRFVIFSDIASHPEFADRKSTKVVGGSEISGYFAIDFTYAGNHISIGDKCCVFYSSFVRRAVHADGAPAAWRSDEDLRRILQGAALLL